MSIALKTRLEYSRLFSHTGIRVKSIKVIPVHSPIFAEIVCNTINFRNFTDKFHRGLFYRYLFGYQQQTYEK